ncbi:MAG: hypothetical protein IJT91_03495, partial [Clostridia bacterium]|nr:hypothetical protein [Clostridia bacterium]
MIKSISVKDCGAVGNGKIDDAAAFQQALDSGCEVVTIPMGRYKIGKTLYIGSNTKLIAHPEAIIRLADNTSKKRGDFLITNKSNMGGHDENIMIKGGIWDGNNETNSKPDVLYDDTACSGAIMNFKNVSHLVLSSFTLKDAGGYNTRFCRVDNFIIENITFLATTPKPNNDGLHFNGFIDTGVIRNLRAETPRTTSDDMIALNADDIVTRCEALDMECGYIRNLVIDGLYAKHCASFIRMLSIDSDITNIKVSNIYGGFTGMVINMDAARYCMTPIIDPKSERFHKGVGCIENVTVDHMHVHAVDIGDYFPYMTFESNMKNFVIRDFVREERLEGNHNRKTFVLRNVSPSNVKFEGLTEEQA